MIYSKAVRKAPEAKTIISMDWSSIYTTAQTVASSSWTVDTGLTIDANAYSAATSTATVSGGTADRSYKLANQVTMSDGQIDKRTILVGVMDR